jgi:hypothetical protein
MPGLSDLLRRTGSIFRAHLVTLLLISAVSIPGQFTSLIESPGLGLIGSTGYALIDVGVYAALIHAVGVGSAGNHPTFVDSYRAALTKYWTVLAADIRTFAAAILLSITVIGMPFGVRLLVRWWLAPQAVILTNRTAKEAISYSCELVSGRWWNIASLICLSFIPSLLFVLELVVWSPSNATSMLAGGALSLLQAPLFAVFWTLLFFDLTETRPVQSQSDALEAV